jgi:glycosyltransferase involved in cell wall biosynthesis
MHLPRKVLYVHHDGKVTGSAISLRNLVSALDRDRYLPHILMGGEGNARFLFEQLGIRVDVIPFPFFATAPGPRWYQPDAWRQYRALFPNIALETFIKDADPDLVHINDKASFSAGLAARRLGKPIVQHLRSSYTNTRLPWNAWVSRMMIRKYARQVIAISEDETDGFEDFTHLDVIYNSVDLQAAASAEEARDKVRRELGLESTCAAICMVGALSEQKGAWDFIRAAGLVAKEWPEVKFLIVSSIPERATWKPGLGSQLRLNYTRYPMDQAMEIARQNNILDKLVFTGYRPDVLNLMAAQDVVVACYRLPAIGRPALEAMSVGRPVITNAGYSGRSKVVINGFNGLTVPGGDVQALANAMIYLARNSDLRHELGQRGRLYAREHFDPQKNGLAVMKIYDELLAMIH